MQCGPAERRPGWKADVGNQAQRRPCRVSAGEPTRQKSGFGAGSTPRLLDGGQLWRPAPASGTAAVGNRLLSMLGNSLLDSLEGEDRDQLMARMTKVAFCQGDMLAEAGEPVHAVHFPVSGALSLISPFQDGAAIEAAVVGREGAIGALAACGSGITSSRVVAKFPGEAWVTDARAFCAVHDASPALRKTLAHYGEVLLTEARQEIGCRSVHAVEARLARMLLTLGDRTGSAELPLSQDFMAELMGVQRTTINAAARVLRVNGGIRYSRGRITILDSHVLQDHACECYGAMRRYRTVMGPDAGAPVDPQQRPAAPVPGQPEPHLSGVL